MKQTRNLWLSIVAVLVLTAVSLAGLLTGRLKPVLGLDLQGGVAVILSAPDGTAPDVMEQTRTNITNRVDAFGVGEPDIFVSGSTIEIQIPGLSNSRVEERSGDVYCLVADDGTNYGCSPDQAGAQRALDGLEVVSRASTVCLNAGDGTELACFGSQSEADNAKALIIVEGRSATPTPSASASASATASATTTPSPTVSPTVGPGPAADKYCLVDAAGTELTCYGSQAEARAAKDGITSKVTETSWCVTPAATPPADATPTPSASASASAKKSASPSASPSPSAVDAYVALDRSGAKELPCDYPSKQAAQDGLAAITVQNVTTQYCVVSSQGQDLGCFTSQAAAADRQRETGQERLLSVIGKTARLEERPTIEVIPPNDPRFATLALTCSTPEEQATKECQVGVLDDQEVVYADQQGNKVRLAPVVITGANIDKATAQLTGGNQTNPVTEWAVLFELDGEGSDAFAKATTTAFASPSPQNQIAIVVDRTIVSNPEVNEPITTGTGQITGNFTEQSAKDLATVLNAGALPVELTQQSVRTVSPTLGEESLKEGIIAGVAGLLLLFVYLLLYYRLLGIVAWFGMSIWAILAIALVSVAGQRFGYALTLAGVAGLVISLGVTADSYIVFFERLKDELRSGKSPRTVVQPAFKRAFRTIVAADTVTGIAAAVLYLTAVSSVRGFALTLGVATLLDLFVVYFFKRPTVFLLARNQRLIEMRGFGLTSAIAADHEALDHTVQDQA